jgi:hypothetical protein
MASKKPTIKVIAIDKKQDGKKAKIMEQWLNHEWKRYGPIFEAVSLARAYIENVYLIKTPASIWERIMERVIQFDIANIK